MDGQPTREEFLFMGLCGASAANVLHLGEDHNTNPMVGCCS